MDLIDMLDPEEYKAIQWGIKNIPDRTYSPDENVLNRIENDPRYIEMAEDEKEVFLSKVNILLENQSFDFNDKDSSLILAIVTDVLMGINQEFNDVFEL